MHSEIRDLAAAVIVEPAKTVERSVLIVAPFWSGSEPCLPVEVGRGIFIGGIADARGPFVLDMERPCGSDLAQSARADELGGFLANGNGASMDAHLADPAAAADRLDHRASLGDAERQRLLDIDIFAGLAGLDCLEGVPVVRHRDDHGVQVFQLEQLPVIVELPERGADLLCRKIHVILRQIA